MIFGFSLPYLLLGYLVGCVFSSHLYVWLPYTDWANIWTYFWIFLWPMGLIWLAFVSAIYYGIILLVIFLVVAYVIGKMYNIGPFRV